MYLSTYHLLSQYWGSQVSKMCPLVSESIREYQAFCIFLTLRPIDEEIFSEDREYVGNREEKNKFVRTTMRLLNAIFFSVFFSCY